MSNYSPWGILADYRDVLFGRLKIGWALAHWQFMNPSTNKQTGTQKKVPEISEYGAANILNENVSIRL